MSHQYDPDRREHGDAHPESPGPDTFREVDDAVGLDEKDQVARQVNPGPPSTGEADNPFADEVARTVNPGPNTVREADDTVGLDEQGQVARQVDPGPPPAGEVDSPFADEVARTVTPGPNDPGPARRDDGR